MTGQQKIIKLAEVNKEAAYQALILAGEIASAISLVGGSLLHPSDVLNMSFGDLLSSCLPNHINVFAVPDEEHVLRCNKVVPK